VEKLISATDAKRKFGAVLRDVEAGNSYIVMIRGRPVARIEPVDGSKIRAKTALLEHLKTLPTKTARRWKRDYLYD
jgi:prevent-host-death family protein